MSSLELRIDEPPEISLEIGAEIYHDGQPEEHYLMFGTYYLDEGLPVAFEVFSPGEQPGAFLAFSADKEIDGYQPIDIAPDTVSGGTPLLVFLEMEYGTMGYADPLIFYKLPDWSEARPYENLAVYYAPRAIAENADVALFSMPNEDCVVAWRNVD